MLWVWLAVVRADHEQKAPTKRSLRRPVLLQDRALQTPFVPEISLANVTEPTAIPPPPPTLNPVTDYQPLDTALGDFIQKQFLEPPTATPPPTQAALSLLTSCPVVILPDRFRVQAPSGCGPRGRHGEWLDTSDTVLLAWNEATYSPSGISVAFTSPQWAAAFGSAVQELSMHGVSIDFYDCGLNLHYTLTEKVMYAPGRVDARLCENPKYGICHGSIFLKYELYEGGVLRALSALVPIFADTWSLVDAAGGTEVVQFTRASAWTPRDDCPSVRTGREWVLTMGVGYMSDPSRRWALGYAATALAMRDEERTNEGLVRMSATESMTWTLAGVVFVLGTVMVAFVWLVFTSFVRKPLTRACIHLEDSLFPMTMYKNSYYY